MKKCLRSNSGSEKSRSLLPELRGAPQELRQLLLRLRDALPELLHVLEQIGRSGSKYRTVSIHVHIQGELYIYIYTRIHVDIYIYYIHTIWVCLV